MESDVIRSARLHQMDGLRGIAMLFVFLGHFGSMWKDLVHPTGAANFFLRLVDADATFGSSLFMLLSAFFAYGSRMRGSKTFPDFLRGRACRLYPLYLIMMVVYIVGSLVFPQMSKLPEGFYQTAIFLVQSLFFLPGILHIRPLMEAAWTLSFVVFFYFVEAALASVFRLAGVSRIWRFLFLITGGILWAVAGDSLGWWDRRTAIFWVGMALSEAVQGMSGKRIGAAMQLLTPAVVITVLGVWLRTELMLQKPDTGMISLLLWRTLITSITLSAFVWVAYFGPVWWRRLLSVRTLRNMGAASYSFYLTHGFALKAFRYGVIPWLGPAAGVPLVFWTSQVAGLALSIVIARMVYLLVENPLSTLVSGFSQMSHGASWRTSATAPAAPSQ